MILEGLWFANCILSPKLIEKLSVTDFIYKESPLSAVVAEEKESLVSILISSMKVCFL